MVSRTESLEARESSPDRHEGETRRSGGPDTTSIAPETDLSAARQTEIDEERAAAHDTRRATVPALEELLYREIPVLDHGFIRIVDYLGDDGAVVQAARVSYGKGTRKVSNDRGLIRYLMRHRHTTPFEMCEIKLHVKLPIFVARQWIRHRTANVNEYSARYSVLDHEFYVPDRDYLVTRSQERRTENRLEKHLGRGQPDLFGAEGTGPGPEHLAAQSRDNRQGRDETLSGSEADEAVSKISSESNRAYTNYKKLLNETAAGEVKDPDKKGLARELARVVLPVNYYTQWYWKTDLHNLLHFLSLRADPHAQYEIRAYADVLCDIVQQWVPLVWEAFKDYQLTGTHISGPGFEVLREMVGDTVLRDQEKLAELQKRSGMSAREFRELIETLRR
jgi:thymidylate synthase (FAD)